MNHYKTLGVRDGANPIEILAAYKALQEAHADSDIETQLNINIAYQTLIHPERRSEFDSTQIRAESSPVKLNSAPQFVQPIQLVQHHHHVSQQSQTQIHPFTNAFIWLIVSYCAAIVLLTVGLVW